MDLIFDITQDELPIFLAETDEQLQTLEEGLLRLEKKGKDQELLQDIFRAAHTLKGSSGLIGHTRMANLTHKAETALDGLRKGTINVSAELVDIFLECVDALRSLRDEVASNQPSDVDIEKLLVDLNGIVDPPATKPTASQRSKKANSRGVSAKKPSSRAKRTTTSRRSSSSTTKRKQAKKTGTRSRRGSKTKPSDTVLSIRAEISPDSIASAARAFQLMLELQGLGDIREMQPDQKAIETATPVQKFIAELNTEKSIEEVGQALLSIADIDRLYINGEEFSSASSIDEKTAEPTDQVYEPPRLGENLVTAGLITQVQLDKALKIQSEDTESKPLLGQTLVDMGAISQEKLDEVVAELVRTLRSDLEEARSTVKQTRAQVGDQTVRTSIERLDNLMNLVGELITNRNRLFRIRSDFEIRYHGDDHLENLVQTVAYIGRITDLLQEEVMRIRMQPVATVFNKLPRLIRDVARKANKKVDLVIRGEETELDRTVIEHISDPLIHLLRNAVDHGIETPEERKSSGKDERGQVLLTAKHERGEIIITIKDDGRGIDPEAIKASALKKGLLSETEASNLSDNEAIELIFESGLSTAKVVSDISGRGVGMDIVQTNIEQLNGTILLDSKHGEGTEFQIVLPLTLAIIPTLLVKVNSTPLAIPLANITETLRVTQQDIKMVREKPTILLRGSVVPLVKLSEALGLVGCSNGREYEYVVAVRSGRWNLGLIVDGFIGEQEVTVKSIGGGLSSKTTGVSGAAILGDGKVALIVDVTGLARLITSGQHRHADRSSSQ